jgi:hypothetical protein
MESHAVLRQCRMLAAMSRRDALSVLRKIALLAPLAAPSR